MNRREPVEPLATTAAPARRVWIVPALSAVDAAAVLAAFQDQEKKTDADSR